MSGALHPLYNYGIYVSIAHERVLNWVKESLSFYASTEVEEDSRCEEDRECIPSEKCPEYNSDRERLQSYSKDGKTNDYENLKLQLQNLVCNRQQRKICCRKTGTNQQFNKGAYSHHVTRTSH